MKKQLLLLLSLIAVISVNAQSSSDSIKEAYSKINLLENRLAVQDTRIAKLMQQVDEVTKQNLSLKKNLKLTPTISRAKAGEIMEYRIIEVTGDSTTNTVHMTMIADNIGHGDKEMEFASFQLIDEHGHGYENSLKNERFVLRIEGEENNKNVLRTLINYHPNAPYTIDAYIYDINTEVKYIKYLSFKVADSTIVNSYKISFENLPIKWVGSTDE